MNATSTSTKLINTLNTTETTVILVFIAGPKLTVTNTRHVRPNTIECPASILAKRRIIKAKGFVNTPTSSIAGIKGIGTFNQTGTSGQNISFQYSFVPTT